MYVCLCFVPLLVVSLVDICTQYVTLYARNNVCVLFMCPVMRRERGGERESKNDRGREAEIKRERDREREAEIKR